MTAVLDASTVDPAPTPTAARRLPSVSSAVPWVIPGGLLVVLLLATGTPPGALARYAAYILLAVLVPGTLVHRALRGSRGNLPEDLGLGGATGFLLMLAGWALGAATGLQALLPAWPALIIVLFLAVPALRRHWRIAEPQPLPALWSWAVAGAITLVILAIYPAWQTTPLPPVTAAWYQDLDYHLALIHEMTRSMPFQVPQLAGDTLRYHYLSDADMATASMITRIDPAVVLLRLWLAPVAAVTALVVAALARQLAGKWWAGGLGALAGLAAMPLRLGEPVVAMGGNPFSFVSPSQVYMLPLAGLLLTLAVDALRGRPLRWAWAMVFPLALACAGAKSSALPPIIAGLAVAALAVLIWHRSRLRPTLILLGLTLAAMFTGLKLFAGGGASILTLQPFAVLYFFPPYRQTLGRYDQNDGDLPLPNGIAHTSALGLGFVAALFAWWLVMQAPRFAGLLALRASTTRRDPAAWLLAGLGVAGAGGLWMFWHPSLSQNYFFLGMIPFATVLTVWLLADRGPALRTVIAGVIAGAVWAMAVPIMGRPVPPSASRWALALAKPLLLTAVVVVLVAAVALVLRRRVTKRWAWAALPSALLAAVLGGGVGTYALQAATDDWKALHRNPSAAAVSVSRDEMAAAQWLERNSGKDDVIATNVHCKLAQPGCDARAFWVAGLTGRRTLVESWGYTDQAVAADGVGGQRYFRQPAPYPARFALNERVFNQGDAPDVAAMRREYGVRWLFADSRVGPIAPGLETVARLRHTSGPVSVYELS